MATGSIVVTFDVGEDIAPGVLACCRSAVMDEFGFEREEVETEVEMEVEMGSE
jgi:hypothetical protein